MEQLKYVAAVVSLICLTAPQIQAHSFRYCEDRDDYDVKVKAVDIDPYPVTICKPFNFSITATTGEEITGGIMTNDILVFGVAVQRKTQDLCARTSCPVSTGDFVFFLRETLPDTTAPGSCELKIKFYNQNNSLLTCIRFDFELTSGSSVADS